MKQKTLLSCLILLLIVLNACEQTGTPETRALNIPRVCRQGTGVPGHPGAGAA